MSVMNIRSESISSETASMSARSKEGTQCPRFCIASATVALLESWARICRMGSRKERPERSRGTTQNSGGTSFIMRLR